MKSLKADDLNPGMVLKDAKKNVYLVVSKPNGKRKLMMLRAGGEGPVLVSANKVGKLQHVELAQDKLDCDHFRDALLDWEFVQADDSNLTLDQINKIFGTNVSLEDLLKRK